MPLASGMFALAAAASAATSAQLGGESWNTSFEEDAVALGRGPARRDRTNVAGGRGLNEDLGALKVDPGGVRQGGPVDLEDAGGRQGGAGRQQGAIFQGLQFQARRGGILRHDS